jgi:hypothetical protein
MTTRKQTTGAAGPKHPVELCYLEELQFVLRNPRYGVGASTIKNEREALDHIVDTFGVNDVLSSIAVNGFSDSEPLVAIHFKNEKKIRVLEGNRRLAACLILTGDVRAGSQTRLHDQFTKIRDENGRKRINPIPVIVYRGKNAMRDVLPYIGVRHIVGTLEWDSYAKAAWIDQVLRDHDLSLKKVMEMLGDKNGTAPRMLAGYRFVNQLVRTGHFRPDQSQRKGRGSNPDYPFSWVYTALDNPPIKEFVGFIEEDGTPDENPVPENKLEQAGWVMRFMFGDKNHGVPAVVEDSREIGELAKAVRDPVLCSRLKEGKAVRLVMEEARPSEERLQEGFQKVADQLKDLTSLIVPGSLKANDALSLIEPAKTISNLAKKALSDLTQIAAAGDDSNEGKK